MTTTEHLKNQIQKHYEALRKIKPEDYLAVMLRAQLKSRIEILEAELIESKHKVTQTKIGHFGKKAK